MVELPDDALPPQAVSHTFSKVGKPGMDLKSEQLFREQLPARAKPYLVKAPPGLFETPEVDIGGSLPAYTSLVKGLEGRADIKKETLFDNSGNVADMKPKQPPHLPNWYPLRDMEIPNWKDA